MDTEPQNELATQSQSVQKTQKDGNVVEYVNPQKPLLLFNPKEYPFGPLSNNYKSFLRINNQLWSTVSHYIYANMVTDPVHQAMLRVAPIDADTRKVDIHDKVKQIMANIEVRQGKPINDPHQIDGIYRAIERETTIRKMGLAQLYNYFLRLEYIQTVRKAMETGYTNLISQRPDLAEELLNTGYGQIIYRDSKDDLLGINDDNVGENIIGQTLMQIRKQLRFNLEKEQKEKQAVNRREQIYIAYKAYMNLLFLLANGDTLKSLLKKTYLELANLRTEAIINPDKNAIIDLFKNNEMIINELQTPGSMVRRMYDENLSRLKNAIAETRSYQIVQAYTEFIIKTKFPGMEPDKIEQAARQLQLSLDIENRKKEQAVIRRRDDRRRLLNSRLKTLVDRLAIEPSNDLRSQIDFVQQEILLNDNVDADADEMEFVEDNVEQLKERRKTLTEKLNSDKYRQRKRAEKRAEMESELDIINKRLRDAPISYEKFVNTIVSLYDTRQLPAEMTSYIQESLNKIPTEKDIERASMNDSMNESNRSLNEPNNDSAEIAEQDSKSTNSSSGSLYRDPLKRLLAGDEKTKKIDLIEQLQRYTGKSYQYYKDYTIEQLERRLAERRKNGSGAYKVGAGVWVLEVRYPIPGGVKTVVLQEYDEKPTPEETMSAIAKYSVENEKDLSLSNATLYWKPKQTRAGVWVLEIRYPFPEGIKTVATQEYDKKPTLEETKSAIAKYNVENEKDLSLSNVSLYWKPKQIDGPEQIDGNINEQTIDQVEQQKVDLFRVYIVQYSSTLSPFLNGFVLDKLQFGSVFLYMCAVLLTQTGLSRNIKSAGNIFSRHRSLRDASRMVMPNGSPMTPAEAMSLYLREKYNTHIEMLTTLARVALYKKFERPEMRTLLSLTNERPLEWNDRSDTWLGVPGNKVGEILMEIRSSINQTINQPSIQTTLPARFSIMINDPFIFSWILQRAAEICRTVQMVRNSIEPGMVIDEKLITRVFDAFYNQCKCSENEHRTQVPETFIAAIRECQPADDSVKELAKKIFNMEISLARENDDFYRITGKSREALVKKISLSDFVQNQREEFERFIQNQVEEKDVQDFLKKQAHDFAVYVEDSASEEYGISLKDIDGVRLVEQPVSSKKRETYEEFARRHGVKLQEQGDEEQNEPEQSLPPLVRRSTDKKESKEQASPGRAATRSLLSIGKISLTQQIEMSQQPPSYDQMQAEQMRRFLLFLNTKQGQDAIGERLEKLRNQNKNTAIDSSIARRWMIDQMVKRQQVDRDRYYGINVEEKTKEEVEQHERNVRDSLERIKQERKRLKSIVEAGELNEIECCKAYWTKITGILMFIQKTFGDLGLSALQNLIISSENMLSVDVKCSGESMFSEFKDEFSRCIGTALTNVLIAIQRVRETYENKGLTENDIDLAASIILGKVIKKDSRLTMRNEEQEINAEELFVDDGLVVESVESVVEPMIEPMIEEEQLLDGLEDRANEEDYGEVEEEANFAFPSPNKKILKRATRERTAQITAQKAKREALVKRLLSPIKEGTSGSSSTVEVLTGPIPQIEEIRSALNTISPPKENDNDLAVYFYKMVKRIRKFRMDHEKKVNRINFFASI